MIVNVGAGVEVGSVRWTDPEELVRAVVARADRVAAAAPYANVVDDALLAQIADEVIDERSRDA